MSKVAFIGTEMEAYPYRLIGLETIVPDGDQGDPSWAERIPPGRYSVLLVSESVHRSRGDAVRSLAGTIDPRSALTIVPDAAKGRSVHLAALRQLTTRALGVDTWTADIDSNTGATG